METIKAATKIIKNENLKIMKITIKGKTDKGLSFNDTHTLTDEEFKVIDNFLSYNRNYFKELEQELRRLKEFEYMYNDLNK